MAEGLEDLQAALEGKYRIERKLGEGGMGTVYLATVLEGGRTVALKVLTPELTKVVGSKRFEDEIKTLESLKHPHILPLLDSGRAGSFLYYVMPYVEGETTLRKKLLSREPLGLEEAVPIVTAVAEALQYAHDRGVTHLDIKPANILMPEGQPVVVDFGIALAAGAARGGLLGGDRLKVGHRDYMPPEQDGSAKRVGPQADVYALAAVLYEALTGERPNRDGTAHLDTCQPEASRPLPAHVAAAMRRALREQPGERFKSAHDFKRALSTVALGDFPFPLADDSKESPYLTWIRNRSDYMGVGGLLDYVRAVGVLIKGLLINLVFVALPVLLIIAVLVAARMEWGPSGGGDPGMGFRNFTFTGWSAAGAALWILASLLFAPLWKVATYEKSLASGSQSSVKARGRYERGFGWVLILIVATALLESVAALGPWLIEPDRSSEMLRLVSLVVLALLGSFKLLSWLGGTAKKLASVAIGLLGLIPLLLIVVYVAHFLGEDESPLSEFIYRLVFWERDGSPDALEVSDALAFGAVLMLLAAPVVAYLSTLLLWVSAAIKLLVNIVHRLIRRPVPEEYSHAWRSIKDVFKLTWQLVIAFALTSAVGVSLEGWIISAFDSPENFFSDPFFFRVLFVLASAVSLWVLAKLTIDINLSSVHGLYRDRLASAFLIGEDTGGDIGVERDLDLAELARHDAGSTAPYHLINGALNLQGSKDGSIRDRKSDFFIFSKRFIGGERTGYCRGEVMEGVFPEMGLSTAMAISAAAASPNMGRSTSPAFVLIMALLNIRLGVWLPNPGRLEEALIPKRHRVKRGAGRVPGCRFEQVFMEELGEVKRRWSQLPNGGERRLHPSNEACYEKTTVVHDLFGVALSGGGIRSATVNLGILQALHARGVFDHLDYMSTVSGGGYLGSSLSALMRHRTKTTSELRGTASVSEDEAGRKIVSVKPQASWLRRTFSRAPQHAPLEYRYQKFAKVAVKQGDRVRAGQSLVSTRGDTRLIRSASFRDRLAWRVPPLAFIKEMLGRLNETWRWVNVSDGGHLENLATMELLRRRCRFIIIGDGEADAKHAFKGLATLMRLARIDLGIEIDIDLDGLRLATEGPRKGRCDRHWALGRIDYPGENKRGYLLYLKSSLTGDEDEVIREYGHKSPLFPHESTADQSFTEGQFEAYRSLGQHIAEEALRELPRTDRMPFKHVGSWFAGLVRLDRRLVRSHKTRRVEDHTKRSSEDGKIASSRSTLERVSSGRTDSGS